MRFSLDGKNEDWPKFSSYVRKNVPMSRSWTGNVKEAKCFVTAPNGLSDNARMLDFRRRNSRLAKICEVKNTVTLNKCSYFNNNACTVNICGAYKFPFTVEKCDALIISVLQEMLAQETSTCVSIFRNTLYFLCQTACAPKQHISIIEICYIMTMWR